MAEENQEEKPSFPLEKILTMSPETWEKTGTIVDGEYRKNSLSDYVAVGVYNGGSLLGIAGIPTEFARIVPEGTEVVLDFRPIITSYEPIKDDCCYYFATGIALIPLEYAMKEKIEEKVE